MTDVEQPSEEGEAYENLRTYLSESSHNLVDIVFAVVVGQSINDYRDILFPPSLTERYVALLFIYAAIILSWIGWHFRMWKYPYQIQNTIGKFRFTTDLAIVVLYSYLLLTIAWIGTNNGPTNPVGPDQFVGITAFLAGFIAIFILYALDDWIIYFEDHFGKKESIHLRSNLIMTVIYVLIFSVYIYTQNTAGEVAMDYINDGAILLAGSVMILWRWDIGTERNNESSN